QYVNLDVNMPSGGSYTWTQPINPPAPLSIGSHTLKVFPVEADGTPLEETAENTRYQSVAIYEQSVPRDKVLMEVFTNSSDVSSIPMHSLLNQMGDVNGMAIVAVHHFPGTPLATSESQNLFEKYAYTTPVFAIDRALFPGEAYIAYSANDFIGLLPDDFIVNIFGDMVSQDILSPCFASLSATGSLNDDNSVLTLDVDIDALPEASAIFGTLAAHVMLVEDGVKSGQAATGIGGRPITNNNYIHNNVVRLNHTGIKGQPVALENNKATLSFTIPMNAAWNPANMRAVVYLTKYFDEEIPANLSEADITNATAIQLGPIASIRDVAADGDTDSPSTFYTIGGVMVDGGNLAPASTLSAAPTALPARYL
ncbi:MAG: Omp28-related outer membrane protein, partial [Muribaculaceae bacterium]|nr:Omp28-related outer membrane protein [Muribaculaceae bacterium]